MSKRAHQPLTTSRTPWARCWTRRDSAPVCPAPSSRPSGRAPPPRLESHYAACCDSGSGSAVASSPAWNRCRSPPLRRPGRDVRPRSWLPPVVLRPVVTADPGIAPFPPVDTRPWRATPGRDPLRFGGEPDRRMRAQTLLAHLRARQEEMTALLRDLARLESPSARPRRPGARCSPGSRRSSKRPGCDSPPPRTAAWRKTGRRPAASSGPCAAHRPPRQGRPAPDRPLRHRLAGGHAGAHAGRDPRRPPLRSRRLRHEGRPGAGGLRPAGPARARPRSRRSSRPSSSTPTRRSAAPTRSAAHPTPGPPGAASLRARARARSRGRCSRPGARGRCASRSGSTAGRPTPGSIRRRGRAPSWSWRA